uniref:Uncharacterized protein n=1 Tax=Magallana gigas TaxID=29159 RepID=K1PGV5_MAGGI
MQKVFSVHHQETTVNCRNFSCPQTSVTGVTKIKEQRKKCDIPFKTRGRVFPGAVGNYHRAKFTV